MKLSLSALAVTGALILTLASSAHAQGPVSKLYVTAGDQATNWILQGTTATSFAQQAPGTDEYAIAVNSTVRTLGNGNYDTGIGAEYTLAGVYTGTNYAYPTSGVAFYDGTTDGTYNYSVDYSGGGVYRTNADWTNAVLLFTLVASQEVMYRF